MIYFIKKSATSDKWNVMQSYVNGIRRVKVCKTKGEAETWVKNKDTKQGETT